MFADLECPTGDGDGARETTVCGCIHPSFVRLCVGLFWESFRIMIGLYQVLSQLGVFHAFSEDFIAFLQTIDQFVDFGTALHLECFGVKHSFYRQWQDRVLVIPAMAVALPVLVWACSRTRLGCSSDAPEHATRTLWTRLLFALFMVRDR